MMAKSAEQRPVAAIANRSLSLGNVTFPILVLSDPAALFWELAYDRYNATQYIAIYPEYREVRSPYPDLVYFSSRGPAYSGLLKPDVVAPGAGILSAFAEPGGAADHGRERLDVMEMDGTSMSCPNVAGSAALVTEYIRKYHGVAPSSSLVKAVIIGSADLPHETEAEPDVDYGFGVVNLGRHLSGLIFADRVVITDQTHLVATVNVIDETTEVRFTISWLDPPSALDGMVPLIAELALIVESPSGALFRGNQHPSLGEEHFSVNQRVIVFPGENELGVWTIHVIANLIPTVETLNFAAVAQGGLQTELMNFIPTLTCVDCGSDGCDLASGLCSCSPGHLGHSCQFEIMDITPGDAVTPFVIPSGETHISLSGHLIPGQGF
jgi:hypothetical protein